MLPYRPNYPLRLGPRDRRKFVALAAKYLKFSLAITVRIDQPRPLGQIGLIVLNAYFDVLQIVITNSFGMVVLDRRQQVGREFAL